MYCGGKQKVHGSSTVPSQCSVVFKVNVGWKPIKKHVDGKSNIWLYRGEKKLSI
jgi:hypothetical protein